MSGAKSAMSAWFHHQFSAVSTEEMENERCLHIPAKKPYMMPMTTTLATLLSPIIPSMSTVHATVDARVIFSTPSLPAKKPGERRPTKLDTFMITSCAST